MRNTHRMSTTETSYDCVLPSTLLLCWSVASPNMNLESLVQNLLKVSDHKEGTGFLQYTVTIHVIMVMNAF